VVAICRGEESDVWSPGKQWLDAPGVPEEGELLRLPDGSSCLLDQGFGGTPAVKELGGCGSACSPGLQLLRTHDARSQALRGGLGAAELDVYPDGGAVKGDAEVLG
jgi:hypothetical protein